MASLKKIVWMYREEIINGDCWVAIHKQGRSWFAECFWPEDGDEKDGYVFDGFDVDEMERTVEKDHKAICINGLICGFGYDFTMEELENKIRFFYDQRLHQLHGDFLECMVIPPAC